MILVEEADFMTHDPLMLSDTAMSLLRQYEELDDQYLLDMVNELSSTLDREDFYEVRVDIDRNWQLRQNIRAELLTEIWFLWTFADIPIVYSLEWHFVFDEMLMAMAETMFAPLKYYQLYRMVTHKPGESRVFLQMLHKSYKEALATYSLDNHYGGRE